MSKCYNPMAYLDYTPTMKIRLSHAHRVLVHDGCGGQVDPVQMYWDGYFETVRESQCCHKCECDIGWRDTVSAIPRRAWKRALVLDESLPDYDFPAEEYEW